MCDCGCLCSCACCSLACFGVGGVVIDSFCSQSSQHARELKRSVYACACRRVHVCVCVVWEDVGGKKLHLCERPIDYQTESSSAPVHLEQKSKDRKQTCSTRFVCLCVCVCAVISLQSTHKFLHTCTDTAIMTHRKGG